MGKLRKETEADSRSRDAVGISIMSLIFSGYTFFSFLFFLQNSASQEWNAVQTALTIFEIFLVIALASGFWMVRREAADSAEVAARIIAQECAEREVIEYVKLFVTPKLIRGIIEGSEDLGGGQNLTETDVNDMMDGLE